MKYRLYQCGLSEIPKDAEFSCFDGTNAYVFTNRRFDGREVQTEPQNKEVLRWLAKAKAEVNKRFLQKHEKELCVDADKFLDHFETMLRKEANQREQGIPSVN